MKENIKGQVEKIIRQKVAISNKNSYWHAYNIMRAKRFLIQTLLIFIFQYLTIINLSLSIPALPMYAPMGIAFTMIYLLGNNALPGLLLAGFCAYFLKNLPANTIIIFLTADVVVPYFGVLFCQPILSSDLRPFEKLTEFYRYLKNISVICLVSAALRLTAFQLLLKESLNFKSLLLNFCDLWLADLNAVLVLSGFLLSWVYVFFSREKISIKPVSKLLVTILIASILISLLFIKNILIIYLLIASMLFAITLSYTYGYLIATALLFIQSCLYLAYFLAHKSQFLLILGLNYYTIVPIVLLMFIITSLYIGHSKLRTAQDILC